jgi:hypothetical protein
MTDLRRALQRVDEVPAPDLWPDASGRQPGPPPPAPARVRVLIAILALAVAAAGIGIGVAALAGRSPNRTVPGASQAPSPSPTLPSPTPSPSPPFQGPVTVDVPPEDGPPQTATLQEGRLVVEAPKGELEWVLNPAGSCSLSVSPLPKGAPLAGFSGGCGGPYLGAGLSGTTWHGTLIRALHGSTVPEPGWIVRVTLDNGDTFDVTPLNGLWMAVVYGCRGTDQVSIEKVAAIDPSGDERASNKFGPLPRRVDPCNRPTPSG